MGSVKLINSAEPFEASSAFPTEAVPKHQERFEFGAALVERFADWLLSWRRRFRPTQSTSFCIWGDTFTILTAMRSPYPSALRHYSFCFSTITGLTSRPTVFSASAKLNASCG